MWHPSKNKRLLVATAVQIASFLAAPSHAQKIIRSDGCTYKQFSPEINEGHIYTYTCDNSDIADQVVAFDCASIRINQRVPDLEEMSRNGTLSVKMPGSPGTPMKWKGWRIVNGTGYESLFWKICRKR